MIQSLSIQNSQPVIESRFRRIEAVQTKEGRFSALTASFASTRRLGWMERLLRGAGVLAVATIWLYALVATVEVINRLLLSMQTLAL